MLWKLLTATLITTSVANYASGQVLAEVGKEKVTVKEFQEKYDRIKKTTVNPPSKEQFLEDLIRFKIGLQEARKSKLDKDPAVIESLERELYKAHVERSLGDQVQKIKVSENEMKKFYQTNPEIRTSHILIEFKPNATEQEIEVARKRTLEILKEVRAEVAKGRPFEELVKLYTDDTLSKNTGGDIGFQSKVTLVPSYYGAVLKMKDGEISAPVRSQYGWHIIKRTGIRPYAEANKRQIRAAVYDHKRKLVFDRHFRNLKKNYKVRAKTDLLTKIK